MHLDEDGVLRLVHDELRASERADALAHVAACETCAAAVARERREEEEVGGLLRRLDHPMPPAGARAKPARRPAIPAWARRAAVLLLIAGAGGVAYAAPGSPLRALLRALRGGAPAPAARTGPAPARAPEMRGVAVAPGAALTIDVAIPGGARVLVRLTDADVASVRAPEGHATFTAGENRVGVRGGDTRASVEIDIPRGAPRVDVSAGGRTLLRKRGPRVDAGVAPLADGSYRLDVAPTRP